MAGVNPYLEKVEVPKPTKPYTITFEPVGVQVEVNPEELPPLSGEGLPGSVLDIAIGNGTDIDHACGGVCACSTCHVIVRQGFESCPKSTDDEEDQLDNAPGLTHQSRLACQCVPDGSTDLIVEIPDWNRNIVKEEH